MNSSLMKLGGESEDVIKEMDPYFYYREGIDRSQNIET